MDKCKYDVCWQGQCKNDIVEGEEYCKEHLNKKCMSCDKQAIGDCHLFNGSFVCGGSMCEDHHHNDHR